MTPPATFNPFDCQAFRDEFNSTLDEKLKIFAQPLKTATADIETLKTEVKAHDKIINRAYGGVKVLAALWTVLAGAFVKHILKAI